MKYRNDNLTDVENVGEQLRRIRKEKGLTQAEAAKLTYHSRDWLSNVEIGRTPITFVDAIKQLDAYGSIDEVDHLVQSICTSVGTRKGSAVIRTSLIILDSLFQLFLLHLTNLKQCEFSMQYSSFSIKDIFWFLFNNMLLKQSQLNILCSR